MVRSLSHYTRPVGHEVAEGMEAVMTTNRVDERRMK